MTPAQKTAERFEFASEDGESAILALASLAHTDAERDALLDAASALGAASAALSHAYDVIGAAAKDRRRQDGK